MIAIGVRHTGRAGVNDFSPFPAVKRIMAIGPDARNLKGIPGIDLAVLADERRTLESIELKTGDAARLAGRRTWAHETAASLRAPWHEAARRGEAQPSRVRPWRLAEALDSTLERAGGGLVAIEQFAVPLDTVGDYDSPTRNQYVYAAGGSEGYGVGATIGLKLAAPDRPVVGLVGDGSLYYSDSGMWTAAHHGVPVLYIIPNNGAYGIVAGAFSRDGGVMSQTGEYAGVVLGGIDPVKIAEGFGVEGMHVEDESRLENAIAHGLRVNATEARPFLLNVRLPLGLPEGGREAPPYRLAAAKANDQAA